MLSSPAHTLTVLTPSGESQLSFQAGATLRDILAAGGIAVRSSCGGNASCGQCQVHVAESGSIPFTTGERARLSAAQLAAGTRLSCQLIPRADLHVSIQPCVTQMVWRSLRSDEYAASMPFKRRAPRSRYGVALDLGTTHIRLTLWEMTTGERIAGRVGLNPQASYGADVLTRLMEAARSDEAAAEMSGLVRDAIAEALAGIAEQHALRLDQVGEVLLVGNTAMLGLLGRKNAAQLLQPENWTRCIDCQPDDTAFLARVWGIAHDADIRFVTSLGGFIGSDLLAGVIATRLIKQSAGSLLIDFGTNSEMALWDGRTLHVTSTAGGPAFEGSGISCGMPGENGAIFHVDQTAGGGFALRVLGDVTPAGICGSGLVDAVAWLLRNGQLDRVGRFRERDGEGFILLEGQQRIVLNHGDIDVLQRAKAAIGGGVRWLCRQAGLPLGSLHRVYACGAFGHLLDVGNAQQIGLLPRLPSSAVQLEGNSALAGCEALLLSDEAEVALTEILKVSKVYNLAEDGDFESLFVENLYLQAMQE